MIAERGDVARIEGLDGAGHGDRIERPVGQFLRRVHTRQLDVVYVEIGEFVDRRTKGLSQGHRTKVALARALVHDPQNIILDEPSNGLDVMATRSLRDLILKLKDTGRCVLFSSHVMQEVAALCDDIVIIANGQVAIDDSADGIRQRTGCDDLEDAFVHAIQMVEPE